MRTPQEILCEVASANLGMTNDVIIEMAMKEYAEQMVHEQRKLMAEYLATHFNMRNVPKPKFK